MNIQEFKKYYVMALIKLMPDGGWGIDSNTKTYEDIFWQKPENKIPQNVLEEEAYNQKLLYEQTEYQRLREKEYPNWKEQFDLLWHDINNNKLSLEQSSFYREIKKIKTKFPKN